MGSPDSPIPVPVLREAARSRVADRGLREAAQEIGMSWSGLRTFLDGTRPHATTVRKVLQWYLRTIGSRSETLTSETARGVLALLVEHLPPGRRESAAAQLLEVVRAESSLARVPPPRWLEVFLVGEEHDPGA